MSAVRLNPEEIATLNALANGIIPPDHTDDGAAAVNAGLRLAEKLQAGIHSTLYLQGLKTAGEIAKERFSREVRSLTAPELDELIGALRDSSPAFFKQLRMDVSALYLSDATVWQRIGFPGPSTDAGGYPDFDQPQKQKRP